MSTAAHRDTAFADAVREVAEDVAAPAADDVDVSSRFPAEAMSALQARKALSALVPTSHGGAGVELRAIAVACFDLSRACSSVGMIYAMHQIQVHRSFGTGSARISSTTTSLSSPPPSG